MRPNAPSVVTCPHDATCGACALLGRPLASQLKGKRDALWAALDRHESLEGLEPAACLPSPQLAGYRNRAKMAVRLRSGRPAELGYFRMRSRSIVDAPDCRVLVPELLETTRQLRAMLGKPQHARLELRFIDARCGSDPRDQHVTLVVGDAEARLPVQEIRAACPFVRGLSLNVNTSAGAQVLKGPIEPLWGERHVTVETSGVRLLVSPGAFFQVNLSILPAIHERMRAHFDGCSSLVDLYAGVGTHGLALAHDIPRVTCIEGVPAAVRDAKSSIAANPDLSHVTVHGAPVERALGLLHSLRPDAIVLNPSREGAKPEVLEAIARSRAHRLAYLSCEPATLARDLALLVDEGFEVASLEPLDMMPQTLQVEALALLERPAPTPPPARPRRASKGPRRRR